METGDEIEYNSGNQSKSVKVQRRADFLPYFLQSYYELIDIDTPVGYKGSAVDPKSAELTGSEEVNYGKCLRSVNFLI